MTRSAAPRPDQPTQHAVTERILVHARRNWPDTEILVRHHGPFCYVAVIKRDPAPTRRWWRPFSWRTGRSEPSTVLRLRYQGPADRWLIAIYKAQHRQLQRERTTHLLRPYHRHPRRQHGPHPWLLGRLARQPRVTSTPHPPSPTTQ